MNVSPVSEFELLISPDTDVEIFYMTRFLDAWKRGEAKLIVESDLGNNMVLTPLIQLPIFLPKKQ